MGLEEAHTPSAQLQTGDEVRCPGQPVTADLLAVEQQAAALLQQKRQRVF